jgi:hypothetical protein
MYLDSIPVDSFLLFEQCLANIWYPYSVPAATRDIVQSLAKPSRLVRPARSYPLTSGGGPTISSLANPSQTTDGTPKSSSTVVYPVDSPLTLESSSVISVNSELSDLWARAEKTLSNDKDCWNSSYRDQPADPTAEAKGSAGRQQSYWNMVI